MTTIATFFITLFSFLFDHPWVIVGLLLAWFIPSPAHGYLIKGLSYLPIVGKYFQPKNAPINVISSDSAAIIGSV